MLLAEHKFIFVKSINVRKGIEHYRQNCDKTPHLTDKQKARAHTFKCSDNDDHQSRLSEEEKKN